MHLCSYQIIIIVIKFYLLMLFLNIQLELENLIIFRVCNLLLLLLKFNTKSEGKLTDCIPAQDNEFLFSLHSLFWSFFFFRAVYAVNSSVSPKI